MVERGAEGPNMVLLTCFRKRAPRARERQSISQGPALTSRVSQSVRQSVISRAHPALTPPPASRSHTSTCTEYMYSLPRSRPPLSGIPGTQSVSQLFHGPAPRSPLHRLAVRLPATPGLTLDLTQVPSTRSRGLLIVASEVSLSQRTGYSIFIATFASEVILSPGLFLFSITLRTVRCV